MATKMRKLRRNILKKRFRGFFDLKGKNKHSQP